MTDNMRGEGTDFFYKPDILSCGFEESGKEAEKIISDIF